MSFEYIDRNLAELRRRIAEAESRANRKEPVMLLAAIKYAEPAEIEYLYRHAGIRQVGENRVQQMLEHIEAIDCEGLEFHFIGTLQTNKVKYIIDKVKMIHSLDACFDGESGALNIKATVRASSTEYLNPEFLVTALKNNLCILNGDPKAEYYSIMRTATLKEDLTEFR